MYKSGKVYVIVTLRYACKQVIQECMPLLHLVLSHCVNGWRKNVNLQHDVLLSHCEAVNRLLKNTILLRCAWKCKQVIQECTLATCGRLSYCVNGWLKNVNLQHDVLLCHAVNRWFKNVILTREVKKNQFKYMNSNMYFFQE